MRIRRLWKRFLIWREKQRRASPAVAAGLAREIAHLTELAELAVLPEQNLAPLRLLRKEMLSLAEFCLTGEFGRMSLQRRLAFTKRLKRTKHFVIATMQEGVPPTYRIQ